MPGSRTIKTLAALVVSLTIGAFALMMLETAPVQAPAQHLAAVEMAATEAGHVIRDTAVPIQPIKWRNIIVHGSTVESGDIADRVHFVVETDGSLHGTQLWRRQQAGHHVYVPGRDLDSQSIGICLLGSPSRDGTPNRQMKTLLETTQVLQRLLQIPADRVYLHGDLDRRFAFPRGSFPAQEFNRALLN